MNDAGGPHGWSESAPIGLELQVTAFAAAATNAIHNTTFYRYKLIYKGKDQLTDAYFGIRSDPDLGNAGDDFVGSDTTLEMAFVYNGDDFDDGPRGYGTAPPALGYTFLKGPHGPSEEDGSLGMTKFVYYNGDSSPQGNPHTGSEAYNYLRGIWRDGSPITHGGTGYGGDVVADYMFPGDPVTKSFWSEENTDGAGARNSPSDRRFLASSGPFNMDTGDTQEIVIAIVWSRGHDNYDSVDRLRRDVEFVRNEFQRGSLDDYPIPPSIPIPELDLSHNDFEVVLAAAEKDTRTLTMTNSGTADLTWEVATAGPNATAKFLTVANAAGPLDPPDQAAFSFNASGFPTPDGMPAHCSDDTVIDYALCNDRPTARQQVGPGRWGIAVGGGTGTYSNYLDRSILGRGRDLSSLGSYDYEWRFDVEPNRSEVASASRLRIASDQTNCQIGNAGRSNEAPQVRLAA